MKLLKRIYELPGFFAVDLLRTRMDPFPGKYPTKWALRWERDGQPDWMYVGKPNHIIMLKVLRFAAKEAGHLTLCEFDKGGAIRSAALALPRYEFRVRVQNPMLAYAYYPFNLMDDFFPGRYGALYSKLGQFGEHKFFFYAPYLKFSGEAAMQRLREYKSWLRKTNQWK